MQNRVKIKQSWRVICPHFSALPADLNNIYLGIKHSNDMLRKILSGFPDLHVMVDTIAKTSLTKSFTLAKLPIVYHGCENV